MRNFKRKDSEYISEIPSTSIKIAKYGDLDLDRYWYDPISGEIFLETTMVDYPYKIVKPYLSGSYFRISLIDVNGNQVNRCLTKFLEEMRNIT